jgi:hypothetical protein
MIIEELEFSASSLTPPASRGVIVIADDPKLLPRYRMPRTFGALPGPRNMPNDKQHLPNRQTSTILSVTVRTDPELLAQLLPPGCEIDGAPLLTVAAHEMRHIRWLADQGYSMLVVSVAMKHHDPLAGWQRGEFIPVLWENLADPIITGREELGLPKLYADLPPLEVSDQGGTAIAAWRGFEFFRMELSRLQDVPVRPAPSVGTFQYKFLPRTGALGEADVQALQYEESMERAAGYQVPVPMSQREGVGTFAFRRARWEDLPLQYPIVNFLADLPLLEIQSASLVRTAVPVHREP